MFLRKSNWISYPRSVWFSLAVIAIAFGVFFSLSYAEENTGDKFSLNSPVSFPVDI